MSEVHRSGVQCGFQFEGEGFIVPLSKVLVELSLLACHQTPAMINRSNGHYKKKGRKPVRNPRLGSRLFLLPNSSFDALARDGGNGNICQGAVSSNGPVET